MYCCAMNTPVKSDPLEGIELTEDQEVLKTTLGALRVNLEIEQQAEQLRSIPLLKEISFWVEGAPLLLGYGKTLNKEKTK